MWRFCIGCIVVVLGIHIIDLGQRNAAILRFMSGRQDGLDLIAADYGPARTCSNQQHTDIYNLASALVTVETLATPRFEQWAKYVLVRIVTIFDMAVPNLSLGPGRIRVSTAEAVLQYARAVDVEYFKEMSRDSLALELFGTCASIKVAASIIAVIVSRSPSTTATVDLKSIREVVVVYNGQGHTVSRAAVLSRAIYFQLVYGLFQHYRFAML